MNVLLKDVIGFISQYTIEILLWVAVLFAVIGAWYVLWPIEQLVITGAITVMCIGAVASAQSGIVTFLKSSGKSKRKK